MRCVSARDAWLRAQLEEHRVEPNSGLGQAITYLLNHWTPLTLFLRQPGAPLDNNVCDAASGITQIMPRPGLCRVGRIPCGSVGFFRVADAA